MRKKWMREKWMKEKWMRTRVTMIVWRRWPTWHQESKLKVHSLRLGLAGNIPLTRGFIVSGGVQNQNRGIVGHFIRLHLIIQYHSWFMFQCTHTASHVSTLNPPPFSEEIKYLSSIIDFN